MEQKLTATRRTDTGKGVARKLRAADAVPGVLYGHGAEPQALAVEAKELARVLHTDAGSNVLVGLVIDGQEHLAMPREIQRDRIRDRYVHVDFLAVDRDEEIEVTVPINVIGVAPGVKMGGVLEHHAWEIQVECRPGDVPAHIDADVSALNIGDSLTVGALPQPSGVRFVSSPDEVIVSVVVPQSREAEAAPTEEGAAAAAPSAEAAAAPAEGGAGEG